MVSSSFLPLLKSVRCPQVQQQVTKSENPVLMVSSGVTMPTPIQKIV